ncbi:MAG: SagB/ThcOx family dehydrogenase [Candidatus Bathyarchaeia archaeon]
MYAMVSRSRLLFASGAVAALVLTLAASYFSGFYTAFPGREPVLEAASGEMIKLPPHRDVGSMSVEEAIAKRRSIREYSGEPILLEDLSQILWAAQGITDPKWGLRAAPSAGATYPLEVYVVVGEGGVQGLEAGIYHYAPEEHSLRLVLAGDHRRSLSKAALEQAWVAAAPVDLVLAAVYERTTARYGERGIRYVHMEAGHVCENVYLQATALGLGAVAVGAFSDEEAQSILHLPEGEKPLYIIPIGHPRR